MVREMDYRDFFTFHVTVFKMFGFWKPEFDHQKVKLIYNCYTLFVLAAWIMYLSSLFVYMYINMNDVEELMSVLYLAGPFSGNLYKMYILYKNMDRIKQLMVKLNDPLFQPNSDAQIEIAVKMKRFHKNFFYLCLYLGMQTYLFYLVLPFLRRKKAIPNQGWFPFETERTPNFEIVFLFQNAVVFSNDLICLNYDTFLSGLLMQISLQCDYLCNSLNNLHSYGVKNNVLVPSLYDDNDDARFNEFMNKNLIVCIQHHKKIKSITKEIRDIHEKSVFLIFLEGGLIICSGLFQLSTAQIGSIKSFMLISYTMCMLAEQFMYCWFGNEVTIKSENIFKSAYNTPWVRCDIIFKKNLLQFMTSTRNPIKIKVGGTLIMSNAVFVSVVKSSYSILTLLQKIQK